MSNAHKRKGHVQKQLAHHAIKLQLLRNRPAESSSGGPLVSRDAVAARLKPCPTTCSTDHKPHFLILRCIEDTQKGVTSPTQKGDVTPSGERVRKENTLRMGDERKERNDCNLREAAEEQKGKADTLKMKDRRKKEP